MITADAPHRLYETFDLPLPELVVPNTNMRERDRSDESRELAESLSAQGQLMPVLVLWNDVTYELVAGFRRAQAMLTHHREFSFRTIRCTRIRREEADTARLVENFVRKNPTTYQFAEYFAQLNRGEHGHEKMSFAQIAAVVGKSSEYVRGLVRFFQQLPDYIKLEWASDRDKRFTFRELNDLVRFARANDEAGARQRLDHILKIKPVAKPELSYKTAEVCLQEALTASEPADSPTPARTLPPRAAKAMAPAEIRALERRLANVGRARLTLHDVGGDVILDLLQALAGRAPPARANEIVEELILATDGRG